MTALRRLNRALTPKTYLNNDAIVVVCLWGMLEDIWRALWGVFEGHFMFGRFLKAKWMDVSLGCVDGSNVC